MGQPPSLTGSRSQRLLEEGGTPMKFKITAIALVAISLLPLMSVAQSVKLKVLHNFGSSNDGNVPSGPLLLDGHGNLYGATSGGPGQYGYGILFKLAPQANGSWRESVLYTFLGGSNGGYPWGALIPDVSGNLYGTMQGYLSSVAGGVFALTRQSGGWNRAVLSNEYAGPGLALDKVGDLYGSIGPGDYFGLGAIGELSPGSSGWTYTQLYSYCSPSGCPGGYNPPAPPIWDASGNLWGTMTQGGITQSPCVAAFGCGVIFEMTPNGDGTWTYNVMHEFASSATDGQSPYGGLVMDAAGNFYGSTGIGGAYNQGTVFKFAYTGGQWVETILYDFPSCMIGCFVDGTLARDKAGNLYGTAAGGTGNCAGYTCGVVFKLAPQKGGAWKYSVLANFTPTTGGLGPFYGVILDSNGNLFGVTRTFGKYEFGTAFEITP
jgi:uncharacterized repeat protein (TIGR03803 family)